MRISDWSSDVCSSDLGEVRAREARRAARDHPRLDIGRERHLLHMDLENLDAALDIRPRHHDLPVEAARAEQRRIEHVGPVGGGDRSEERRVGKGWGGSCSCGWWSNTLKKKETK